MANKKISYVPRDFQGLRDELVGYVSTYYPELIQNVNDAALFSVFLDLNAAVADNLHYHIDRSIQETVLQYAQQKTSIYNIARTYGLKIPGQRPSVALADFSITVPAFGDKEDTRYLGMLRAGSQAVGSGQVFELVNDCDFSSPFNNEGYPNRLKIPNFDANGNLINYTITKREVIVNGITKVLKKVINTSDVRPFLEVFLPEKNVLGVTAIIQKDGTSYVNTPSNQDFLTLEGKWYEVDALIQDRVFIEDPTKTSDNPGVKVGQYIQTDNRFITEYTPEGYFKLTFGGGTNSAEDQLREFTRLGVPINLSNYQNTLALGNAPTVNTTFFIQYRIGGGLSSNIGVSAINTLGTIDFSVVGPSQDINTSVVNSLRVNNVTAAVGGANQPNIEEVRNFVSYNFAAQNRAVTVNDYEAIIRKMPSKFGAPAKVAIVEEDNKIKIQILSYDTTGKLTQTVSNTLKNNLATYLSNYRMMNDYVQIDVAEVLDLAVDLSVVLDGAQNQGVVVSSIIDLISTYMNPLTRQLGQNVFASDINRLVQAQNGVISVSDISFYGKVGGEYSSSETSQPYEDDTTKKIGLVDQTIFATPSQIYQVRYPNKDITVRVKNLTQVSFS
jgi:hypothetical protein